jgi:TonB-dependent receptor
MTPNLRQVGLTNDLQLRLSYAQTISYPDFGQFNPATNLVPPTVNRLGYGSGGNPNLKPITSDNYGRSLAWYFAPGSDLSIAGFYRSINGYIQFYTSTEVHGGVKYNVTRPHSAGSGYLYGAEFSYQQFFRFLPGPFSGLGAQFNYTYINGQTKSPQSVGGPVKTTPLAQVSKNTYNLVLIYEKYGISTRLAYNFRSQYSDNLTAGGVQQPPYNLIKPAHFLDLAAGYQVTDQVTLTFDATNLTGSNFHDYLGSSIRPRDLRLVDQTYSLGVRVKF